MADQETMRLDYTIQFMMLRVGCDDGPQKDVSGVRLLWDGWTTDIYMTEKGMGPLFSLRGFKDRSSLGLRGHCLRA